MAVDSPLVVQVSYGDNNALTGQPDVPLLMRVRKGHVWPPNPQQNYMVLPEQRWLANYNSGAGEASQFVPIDLSNLQAMNEQKAATDAGAHSLTVTAYPQLPSNGDVFVTPSIGDSADCELLSTPSDIGLSAGECVYLRSTALPGASTCIDGYI